MNTLEARTPIGDGVVEEAVVFSVGGSALRGNTAFPADGAAADTGVVFMHGWSGYRDGPHGLLTFLARRLAAAGHVTLRFDARGRGESEGDGLAASLVTMADDVAAASEWLVARHRLRRLVYLGMCSGGNVVIGCLPRLPKASGLVLLSVYPFSDGDTFGRDVHRTWHYAAVYLRKACRGETWGRLLRGDVHILQVLRVLFGHFLRRGANRRKEEGAGTTNAPAREAGQGGAAALGKTAKPTAAESRLEGREPPKKHLANLRPDLPALFVYGTADPDAPAALAYYGSYVREKGLPARFVEIEGASHNFPSAAWKERLAEMAIQFVRTALANRDPAG